MLDRNHYDVNTPAELGSSESSVVAPPSVRESFELRSSVDETLTGSLVESFLT